MLEKAQEIKEKPIKLRDKINIMNCLTVVFLLFSSCDQQDHPSFKEYKEIIKSVLMQGKMFIKTFEIQRLTILGVFNVIDRTEGEPNEFINAVQKVLADDYGINVDMSLLANVLCNNAFIQLVTAVSYGDKLMDFVMLLKEIPKYPDGFFKQKIKLLLVRDCNGNIGGNTLGSSAAVINDCNSWKMPERIQHELLHLIFFRNQSIKAIWNDKKLEALSGAKYANLDRGDIDEYLKFGTDEKVPGFTRKYGTVNSYEDFAEIGANVMTCQPERKDDKVFEEKRKLFRKAMRTVDKRMDSKYFNDLCNRKPRPKKGALR